MNETRELAEAPRMTRLWIAGAGGFGRETLDAIVAAEISVAGFLDDDASLTVVRGLTVMLPLHAPAGDGYIVAIAAPSTRQDVADRLSSQGLCARSIVHPAATIGPETVLGAGSVVLANAYVSSSVTLGLHTQINYNATVGHDAVLEDCVTVLPGANIGGNTVLEHGVLVGSNAAVLQGVRIGSGATIGAGAVVTRDVEPWMTVVGAPARPMPR